MVFAIAHVRGGGDLGRRWYDEGKLAAKPNSFADLRPAPGADRPGLDDAAATHHRRRQRRRAAWWRRRPTCGRICSAVVAEVPFVDVINTMLDETLPLTVGEFLEWGNPKTPADYAVMRATRPTTTCAPPPIRP